MISAMPRAAVANTSSAFLKASESFMLPYWSRSLSVLMRMSVSTHFFSSSMPAMACSLRRRPSRSMGMVTMPTVRMPLSLAILATTGAAPVPVPPPIPAVTKSILVFSSISASSSSRLISAASRPMLGSLPAPKSRLPRCTVVLTLLFSKAWWSVLHKTKSTPWMPSSIMWLTALPPPPPTPTTLI